MEVRRQRLATVFTSIDEVECHFNWQLEKGSTKDRCLDDVIKKTERKMSREPYMKVAFLTTLAYLHAHNSIADIAKAEAYLNDAKDLVKQVQSNADLSRQHLACEFIVLADELHLKHMRNQLTQLEIDERLQHLTRMWNDPTCKAQLLGVKGATSDCFGPSKYKDGIDAFAEASKLEPENFHWLFGEARLLGRVARSHGGWEPANDRQLLLWQKAQKLGENLGLANALFYAHYAEGVLYNLDWKEICKEQCRKSVAMLERLSPDEKENFHLAYIINIKVLRVLELPDERNALVKKALKFESIKEDPGYLLEIAKSLSYQPKYHKKAIQLLEKGKKLDPTNIWIGLKLIEVQIHYNILEKEAVLNQFDSLRQMHSNYKLNLALIEFQKALYLLEQGDTEHAVRNCVLAYEVTENVVSWMTYYSQHRFMELLVENQDGYEEYVAWFLHVTNLQVCKKFKSLDAEKLFKTALEKRPLNSEFAMEQLGRYYLDKEKVVEAARLFRDLPVGHARRSKLLTRALLLSPACTADTLAECLELGCKDAAIKMLDAMELESKRDQQQMYWFCSTTYELCARIESLVHGDNGFFIKPPESTDSWSSCVTTRIEKLLRLRDEHCLHDKDMTSIRQARLEACKCKAVSSKEEYSSICAVLVDAKNSLDRSVKRLSGGNSYFPFAFHSFVAQKPTAQLRLESSDRAIAGLKAEIHEAPNPKKRIRKHVKKKIDFKRNVSEGKKNGLINFLADRELRIIEQEDAWIVVFSHAANDIKYNAANLSPLKVCNLLDKLLASNKNGSGPNSAYELMHQGAEFAEETLLEILKM